ncbi:hypothetical protein AHF37_09772 [Paragonimus kellicotti]|nr:hypothetical protein AHF37_09772 [Paragonimus kellicotti]
MLDKKVDRYVRIADQILCAEDIRCLPLFIHRCPWFCLGMRRQTSQQ